MNRTQKTYSLFAVKHGALLFALCLPGLALSAPLPVIGQTEGKNCHPVEFRTLPAHYEEVAQKESGKWSFRFFPYGNSAASWLWTDPGVQRNTLAASNDLDGKQPAALYFSCDEEGFSFLLYSVENGMTNALAEGKEAPNTSFECFFVPGAADTKQVEHYYQFFINTRELPDVQIWPWLVNDRSFRTIQGYLQADVRHMPNGNVVRVFVPWTAIFDRLPLNDKVNNFWRFSLCRWSGGGGTWGGVVHAVNSAGYIRWPEFTPAQRAAIRKNTLLKGYGAYRLYVSQRHVNPSEALMSKRTASMVKEDEIPHSTSTYNEDYPFRADYLTKLIAERNALGAGIQNLEKLPEAEQDAFYQKASQMLFNFRYDLEDAYNTYLTRKLFTED